MIGLAIVGVFMLHFLFLLAVTGFSARALWRCNTLLALWIGPFFFAVFVFVSGSLIVTGMALRRWGNESFPYRLGPLTVAAAIGLIVMVGFALVHQLRARPAQGMQAIGESPSDGSSIATSVEGSGDSPQDKGV